MYSRYVLLYEIDVPQFISDAHPNYWPQSIRNGRRTIYPSPSKKLPKFKGPIFSVGSTRDPY